MTKIILMTITLLLGFRATKAQVSVQSDTIFKPSGKISGYLLGDFAFKFRADEQKRGSQQYSALKRNYGSFNIRRL